MKMTIPSPSRSPLTIDDLNAMTMAEISLLIKDIDNVCKQAVKDLKAYSDNMKLIQKFVKDKISV